MSDSLLSRVPISLFDLPLEVLGIVIGYVVTNKFNIELYVNDELQRLESMCKLPSIFNVCHLLRHIAIRLFFDRNTFFIDPGLRWSVPEIVSHPLFFLDGGHARVLRETKPVFLKNLTIPYLVPTFPGWEDPLREEQMYWRRWPRISNILRFLRNSPLYVQKLRLNIASMIDPQMERESTLSLEYRHIASHVAELDKSWVGQVEAVYSNVLTQPQKFLVDNELLSLWKAKEWITGTSWTVGHPEAVKRRLELSRRGETIYWAQATSRNAYLLKREKALNSSSWRPADDMLWYTEAEVLNVEYGLWLLKVRDDWAAPLDQPSNLHWIKNATDYFQWDDDDRHIALAMSAFDI
ncbi:MAG: hypothetical protein M1814_006686 [Vezdaea aestivalis]|nr:MAG: hypothetical protein M1814_006686 [Vezdaea aestivalis]